jgi:hypothetical protein
MESTESTAIPSKSVRVKRALGKLKEVLLKKKITIAPAEAEPNGLFAKSQTEQGTCYQILPDRDPFVFENP